MSFYPSFPCTLWQNQGLGGTAFCLASSGQCTVATEHIEGHGSDAVAQLAVQMADA